MDPGPAWHAWGRRSSRFSKVTPALYFFLPSLLPSYLLFFKSAFSWIRFFLTLTDLWCAGYFSKEHSWPIRHSKEQEACLFPQLTNPIQSAADVLKVVQRSLEELDNTLIKVPTHHTHPALNSDCVSRVINARIPRTGRATSEYFKDNRQN